MMNQTNPLYPGNMLGICAPSGRFDVELLDTGIQILTDLGFQVKIHKDIYLKKRYLAGDDHSRAGIINSLFSDPLIDGIICARGGFGALRILDYLDWDLIRQNPKPFIGFSDITSILMAIIKETSTPVIHGPNVVSLSSADQETLNSLISSLSGVRQSVQISHLQIICEGACEGVLKGGNLATLCHMIGTRFQPSFSDSVFFFEDIGEPAYKIDRMLTQMKMAGLFVNIRGVIAGSFKNCSNDEFIEEIIKECFESYQVPVISGFRSGHGKTNLSMTLGKLIRLDTDTLKIEWA